MSDIELHPELIDIRWLCRLWADLERFPQKTFDRLHGAWLLAPFGSATYDDLDFLTNIAHFRVYGD